MARYELDRRLGGLATMVGYLIVFGGLLWNIQAWLAALDSAQGILYFFVLPAIGLGSAVWAVLEQPFSGPGLFLAGSYLAVVGLALSLGFVPVQPAVRFVGVCLFVLALVSTIAGLRALWTYFQIDTPVSD